MESYSQINTESLKDIPNNDVKALDEVQTDNKATCDVDQLFKPRKKPISKKSLRKRTVTENDETSDPDDGIKRTDLLNLMELRQLTSRKTKGLDTSNLLNNTNKATSFTVQTSEPNKPTVMGSFTTQVNKMDRNAHLEAYIQVRMQQLENGGELDQAELDEEDSLGISTKNKGREGSSMLSAAMLTRIPEVDLGIENQLTAIEKTEKAKMALNKSQSSRAGIASQTPANPYHALGYNNRKSRASKPVSDLEAFENFKKRQRR